MEQFEKQHQDFKYLGTVAIDFKDYHPVFKNLNLSDKSVINFLLSLIRVHIPYSHHLLIPIYVYMKTSLEFINLLPMKISLP